MKKELKVEFDSWRHLEEGKGKKWNGRAMLWVKFTGFTLVHPQKHLLSIKN